MRFKWDENGGSVERDWVEYVSEDENVNETVPGSEDGGKDESVSERMNGVESRGADVCVMKGGKVLMLIQAFK